MTKGEIRKAHRGVMACPCEAFDKFGNRRGGRIRRCKMHEAAPLLARVLAELLAAIARADETCEHFDSSPIMDEVLDAEAALAAAGVKEAA